MLIQYNHLRILVCVRQMAQVSEAWFNDSNIYQLFSVRISRGDDLCWDLQEGFLGKESFVAYVPACCRFAFFAQPLH